MTSSHFKVKFAKRLDTMVTAEPRTTLAQVLTKSGVREGLADQELPCSQKTRPSSHHWLSFKSRANKV
jgi:hypothetical protein